ncbi:Transcription initiation factor TFIID subunit [Arachis hypogaea]|nr:Transcription initiation factor TFIID subunit [Arachis hypogaea]
MDTHNPTKIPLSSFHATRYEHTTSFLFIPERLLPLVTRSLKLELSHSLTVAHWLSHSSSLPLSSPLSLTVSSLALSRARSPSLGSSSPAAEPAGPGTGRHHRSLSHHRLTLSRALSLRSSSAAAEPAGLRLVFCFESRRQLPPRRRQLLSRNHKLVPDWIFSEVTPKLSTPNENLKKKSELIVVHSFFFLCGRMSSSGGGSSSKPRSASFQPSETSSKRKRGVFQKNPLPESVALMEDIVVEYVTELVHKAQDIGSQRGKLSVEDFLYLIRKDLPKLNRCTELLSMNEELKQARKVFESDEDKLRKVFELLPQIKRKLKETLASPPLPQGVPSPLALVFVLSSALLPHSTIAAYSSSLASVLVFVYFSSHSCHRPSSYLLSDEREKERKCTAKGKERVEVAGGGNTKDEVAAVAVFELEEGRQSFCLCRGFPSCCHRSHLPSLLYYFKMMLNL